MSQMKRRGGKGHMDHTLLQCNRGSKFACNKTKKKQFSLLEMSDITKTSQSMVLILTASFKRWEQID